MKMAKRTKKFCKGMKVCSIYEPERVFVLTQSAVPDGIFHEKGSHHWWTKNEVRAAEAASL